MNYKGLFMYGFEFKGLSYTMAEFFKPVPRWDKCMNMLGGYAEI
jgi:hypothetical protein